MFQCKAGLGMNVLYDSTYVSVQGRAGNECTLRLYLCFRLSVQGRAGNECTLRLYLCFSARPGWEWMYSTTLLMFQCKAGLGMNVPHDSTYVSVQGRAGNECTLRLSLCFSARPGWEWMYSTTLLMFQCKAGLGMNVLYDSPYVSVQGRAGNECTLRLYLCFSARPGWEWSTVRLYLCFSARPGWEWMYRTTLLMFQCKAGLGMNVLYDLLYKKPPKIMLLGPGCSVVSTFVGQAAHMWNLVVVSRHSLYDLKLPAATIVVTFIHPMIQCQNYRHHQSIIL